MWIPILINVAIIILLILVFLRLKKCSSTSENYCVDISGGFAPPCDSIGRCVVNV